MRAMIFKGRGQPLELQELPTPVAGPGQIRIKVSACGICRTDLHVVDGDLKEPVLPLIPGHQIIGTVDASGSGVEGFAAGERVGVPWLGGSCGACW